MSVGPLERALSGAVRAAEVQPRHRAAVAAARRLAQLLDGARAPEGAELPALEAERAAWDKLGARYLAALAAAGLTVAAGSVAAPPAPSSARTALEALREQAASRGA